MGAFDQRGQVVGQQTNVGQRQDKHASRQRICIELSKAVEALGHAAKYSYGIDEDGPGVTKELYDIRNRVYVIHRSLSNAV